VLGDEARRRRSPRAEGATLDLVSPHRTTPGDAAGDEALRIPGTASMAESRRSPRIPRILGLAAAVGMLAIACGAPRLELRPTARAFTPRDYERVYDDWTRSTEAYSISRFTDVLRATATWQGWEFRWAYVVRYAEDYDLPTERRAELLRESLADAEQHHRFFITMSGSRIRETDLTSRETAWRLLLVSSDGRSVAPDRIEKVIRPGAVERTYFPSVNPWRLAFRVSFPTVAEDGEPLFGPGTRRATLRFTGALGTVDLDWRLEGPGDDVAEEASGGNGRFATRR
jgi:hypothetical protein